MMKFLTILASLACVSLAAACKTDKDCPSSYCQNDKTKKPPYTCHLCGDNCCLTDSDCSGSYCVNDPTKTPPYFCHSSASSTALFAKVGLGAALTPAPAPAAPPSLTPAAAQDAKDVEKFLEKYSQVVAGVAIAVGLIFTFAGYKYMNVTLFLSGAAAAGFVSYVLLQTYLPVLNEDKTKFVGANKPAIMISVTGILALIGGFLCYKLRKIGTFVAGATGGAACAVMLNAVCLKSLRAPDAVPNLWLYVAVVVLSLIAGVLALKMERVIFILATSLAGSLAVVGGAGKFIGHFPSDPSDFVDHDHVSTDGWVWAYAGVFVLLAIAGIVVQFRTTMDRKKEVQQEHFKNSLLYSAPPDNTTSKVAYVDHVSGYHTAV